MVGFSMDGMWPQSGIVLTEVFGIQSFNIDFMFLPINWSCSVFVRRRK
jgi:hypothetical protein